MLDQPTQHPAYGRPADQARAADQLEAAIQEGRHVITLYQHDQIWATYIARGLAPALALLGQYKATRAASLWQQGGSHATRHTAPAAD